MTLPTVTADELLRKIEDVVVYCSSPDCDDSIVTATRLQKLGYSNVRHYPGGKDKWRDLGLPLERAGRPFVPK